MKFWTLQIAEFTSKLLFVSTLTPSIREALWSFAGYTQSARTSSRKLALRWQGRRKHVPNAVLSCLHGVQVLCCQSTPCISTSLSKHG